jgi:hypothetical protein
MNLYHIVLKIFGSGTGVKASFDAVAVLDV